MRSRHYQSQSEGYSQYRVNSVNQGKFTYELSSSQQLAGYSLLILAESTSSTGEPASFKIEGEVRSVVPRTSNPKK
jgi:hypothetical protein